MPPASPTGAAGSAPPKTSRLKTSAPKTAWPWKPTTASLSSNRSFWRCSRATCPERLYGAPATLYTGPGYILKDKPLLDLTKLPAGIPLGLQTGRSREEAQVGLELCGLAGLISDDHIITKNNGFPKPLPGGLRLLAKHMGFRTAVYVGDTRDDLRTVQAFNADRAEGDAVFLSAQVLTGPLGRTNEKMFRNSGADIVASDVNEVLEWVSAKHG